jgi:hypothetical protein
MIPFSIEKANLLKPVEAAADLAQSVIACSIQAMRN